MLNLAKLAPHNYEFRLVSFCLVYYGKAQITLFTRVIFTFNS